MGKASRTKRRRAAVRSAKRSRNNSWWYGLTTLIVIVGIALIVYAKATAPAPVGPFVLDQNNPANPHNKDSHWHAILGVYNCTDWMGDGGAGGPGTWVWQWSTPSNSPARENNTNVYAGLHSHDDGIIHMEPQVAEESGRHATLGKYFEYGGWSVNSNGFNFLGTKVKTGDPCGGGKGTFVWGTGKADPNHIDKKVKLTQQQGNPADFKLHDNDMVVLAFLPPGKTLDSIGNPPSTKNLPGAATRESSTATTVPSTPATSAPGSTSPTTAASTPTTGATPTTAKP